MYSVQDACVLFRVDVGLWQQAVCFDGWAPDCDCHVGGGLISPPLYFTPPPPPTSPPRATPPVSVQRDVRKTLQQLADKVCLDEPPA